MQLDVLNFVPRPSDFYKSLQIRIQHMSASDDFLCELGFWMDPNLHTSCALTRKISSHTGVLFCNLYPIEKQKIPFG